MTSKPRDPFGVETPADLLTRRDAIERVASF
jgi:hypothetical protein